MPPRSERLLRPVDSEVALVRPTSLRRETGQAPELIGRCRAQPAAHSRLVQGTGEVEVEDGTIHRHRGLGSRWPTPDGDSAARVALLYIAEQAGGEVPAKFRAFWRRLFGPQWATTEGGRGLRELMRELGKDPEDAWIVGEILRRAWGE